MYEWTPLSMFDSAAFGVSQTTLVVIFYLFIYIFIIFAVKSF